MYRPGCTRSLVFSVGGFEDSAFGWVLPCKTQTMMVVLKNGSAVIFADIMTEGVPAPG